MADKVWSASAAHALHAIADGVAIFGPDWTISYINIGGAALLNHRPEELIGRNMWEAFPEAVGTVFHSGLLSAREGGGPVTWEGYYEPVQAWFEDRAMRAGDDVVVFFRDISERRAVEEEREQLTASLRSALDRSRLLLRVGEALTSALTLQDIADTVVSLAGSGLGTHYAGLALLDRESRRFRYVSMKPLPAATRRVWQEFDSDLHTPGATAARTGRAVFVGSLDELADRFPAMVDDYRTAGVRATAHLPLKGTGGVLGTLVLAWSDDHVVADDERTVVHTLAGYTAQALQRSLLFAERMSAAETLQRSMLPTLPRPDHLELAARYRPANAGDQVGGDWYDAFHLPDGALAMVIGDVVGHDMQAAAAMGQLRNMLRGFAYDRREPPSDVLRRLDEAMTGLALSTVATAILARVEQTAADRARGLRRLRWSNAGHPAPLLINPDGSVHLLTVQQPDPLLGLHRPMPRFDSEQVLQPESTVLFYTDGLIERRDVGLDDGTRRLRAVVTELAALPVDQLLDALLDRMVDGGVDDDVALLAVRAHRQDPIETVIPPG